MGKEINVMELLGADIRSRSNARMIENAISERGGKGCVINMEGVAFVSRSFSDELLNICKSTTSTIVNAHDVVRTMLGIVDESRRKGKEKEKGNENIVELQDMKSLEAYFATF